jgi:tetratricopeptide (TPR) repeat protein
MMEGEDGNARLIDSDRLRILLQGKDRLRLAVLNSCLGAQASESEPLSSVAAAMVQAGVPAVIAMQFEVSDKAAEIIAGTFYQSLALNFPVDAAITEARRQIALLDNDSLEWATPVLFMQVPDGQLFDISTRLPDELPAEAPAGTSPAVPTGTHSTPIASAPEKSGTGGPPASKPSIDLNARAEEAYRTGEMAEMRGDWEGAINGYQGALFLVPGYKDAAQKLAYCERRNHCVQLYGKAQTQYAEKQYAQVLETLQQLRAIDPRWVDSADLETLSECGLVYEETIATLQAGDRAKGAELFRSIISKRPDFEDAVERLDNLAAGGDGLFGMHTEPQYGSSQPVAETPQSGFTQPVAFTEGQKPLQGGEEAYPETQSPPPATPSPPKDQRVYTVSGFKEEALAEELRQYFLGEGHETQVISQGSTVVVQGKKGGWRTFVGMSQAATVMIEATEEGFNASVGGGKWIEQGAAIAVSVFVLWPLLITGGVGMAQQKKMMDELWRIIDNHAVQRGGLRKS